MGNDDPVTRCLRRHSRDIATITGIYLVIGAFFTILVVVLPGAQGPGEAEARIGVGLFGLLWLVVGVVHRLLTKKKRDRIAALLGPARAELARLTLVEIRRRHVTHYAVDLTDKAGATYRLTAPTAQDASNLAAQTPISP